MECHPAFHDSQPKAIFRGIVINTGSNCAAGLELALDALSNHPSTAPFISRQLIQRFVTSNPSPGYIRRVAQAWTGSGGDLGLVLRTILLDSEARNPPATSDATWGKPREPLLRIAHMWRAYQARYVSPADGSLRFRARWPQFLRACTLAAPARAAVTRLRDPALTESTGRTCAQQGSNS